MSEIEARRQRALEAYWDVLGTRSAEVAAQEAIETATRVKITDEAIEAAWNAQPVAAQEAGEIDLSDVKRVIAAALAALGFEVEQ